MDALIRLRAHLEQVPDILRMVPETELTDRQPGKWSRKELLGHLIDSAVNNLKRFTDAQFAEGRYLVQSYRQDELVRVNNYQQLPLSHLLTLWRSLNSQILYVVEAIPERVLSQSIQLSQADADPVTLAWLITDYVDHMEHHLKVLV